MDLFSVLSMFGGLALFLFGMNAMGDGLEKMSGGKLEGILERLTSNPIKAVGLGAAVTAVIQSSSATTVMVVGFVNSGIMKLSQAIGIIMGANIGTTVTSWILSLSGISSSNFFIKLLKPSSFSPILAIIGVIFLLFSKKEKRKNIGSIMVSFAILMFGMEAISDAVKPLADVPEFTNILLMFSNPILGMLAGAALTAVIQSSSASVGILQALCVTGAVTYSSALPIILGQNIGTCVTAILSSIGASKNAKRAAIVHLYFNIIGTFVFMVVFYGINVFANFGFLYDTANAAGIAVIHSSFNVAATFLLLPFSKMLEKLAYLTIRDDKDSGMAVIESKEEKDNDEFADKLKDEFNLLDDRFLETPSYAVAQCKKLTVDMARMTQQSLDKAFTLPYGYDNEVAKEVIMLENAIDMYEDHLGTYMVKLSSKDLFTKDSKTLSTLLHCIGDFERMSDHAVNICETAEKMYNNKIDFSNEAREEINVLVSALKEIIANSISVFEKDDELSAISIEPLEETIDDLCAEIKMRHINRLRDGSCSIDSGLILSDLVNNIERIADHCSNIAVCIIEIKANGFDTHEYLNVYKRESNKEFIDEYNAYKSKYMLN